MQAKDIPNDRGCSIGDQESTQGAAAHMPKLLSLFRVVWIAGCVLTVQILVVLLFVRQSSAEMFLALGGVVCAFFAGVVFLLLAQRSIHRAPRQLPPRTATEPDAPSIPEPECFVAADRLLFARRVHCPRRVDPDPDRLIYQEGRFIQVVFLLLLFGLGVTL